jgi:cytochrome c-type biogenesis protein
MQLFVAFLSGLLSFFSPCVFPIIPSYILYLAGTSFDGYQANRRAVIINSLFFILGFFGIFLIFGAMSAYFGQLLFAFRETMKYFASTILIVFGLFIMGAVRIGALNIERKIEIRKPIGYFGSFVLGVTFAAAWTPCVGPILGSILLMATISSSFFKGFILLFFYSLGLAIPFLITAVFLDYVLIYLKMIKKYLSLIQFISGLILVIIGILMFAGIFRI